jgi:hypothetical protein
MLYTASVGRFEWLDAHTLLLRGHVSYAVEESGIAQATI